MKNFKRKNSQFYACFLFWLPTLWLLYHFPKVPDEIDWSIVLFLCIMVVFDRMNLKVFAGFGYSFFIVVLGLIIFDNYSIVYGLIYITVDCIYVLISKRYGSVLHKINLVSIYTIIIILSNEFYNNYTGKDYAARYLTLLLLLSLHFTFRYIYSYLETRTLTTKQFVDMFGPMLFEVVLIFPILAFFNEFNVNLILILFLSYYTFIGYLHRKFMGVNDAQIQEITQNLKEKHNIEIYFLDLGKIKGVFDAKKKVVFIDEKLDYPEQLQTIIHELLHYAVRRKLSVSKRMEELIVTLFEAIISWYYIIKLKNDYELD